ncbi:MAG: hypothetical protein ACREDK_03795 [Thermoplasmata archaeon]
MVPDTLLCIRCGEEIPPGVTVCPACATPVPEGGGATVPVIQDGGSATSPKSGAAPVILPPPGEVTKRAHRLAQWGEAAQPLGVALPSLPSWAEEFARGGGDPEPWNEVLRGIERLAQKKVVHALEEWEHQTKNRLSRLEAYSVDGRLEREQMEDILHAARTGEVGPALSAYQQVDRVVALKERHLDQAREELERLVSMMRDMQALGLPSPQDPGEIAEDLERELRGGRLAPLKQQLRAMRTQAVNRLKVGLPEYVTRYGEFLQRERATGIPVELETAELVRGAHEFARGHPEEALRRLRVLAQVHGSGASRSVRVRPPPPDTTLTGASRKA